jgi:hypothetical protein
MLCEFPILIGVRLFGAQPGVWMRDSIHPLKKMRMNRYKSIGAALLI